MSYTRTSGSLLWTSLRVGTVNESSNRCLWLCVSVTRPSQVSLFDSVKVFLNCSRFFVLWVFGGMWGLGRLSLTRLLGPSWLGLSQETRWRSPLDCSRFFILWVVGEICELGRPVLYVLCLAHTKLQWRSWNAYIKMITLLRTYRKRKEDNIFFLDAMLLISL